MKRIDEDFLMAIQAFGDICNGVVSQDDEYIKGNIGLLYAFLFNMTQNMCQEASEINNVDIFAGVKNIALDLGYISTLLKRDVSDEEKNRIQMHVNVITRKLNFLAKECNTTLKDCLMMSKSGLEVLEQMKRIKFK